MHFKLRNSVEGQFQHSLNSQAMQFPCLEVCVSSALLRMAFFPLLVIYLCVMRMNLAVEMGSVYNTSIPAVFVFGDSIVDTGNNNFVKTLVKVNYLPYGRDFMGGRPTGRFSDGKVPSDLFVEELGIKGLLPAYLDPSLQAEDLITGVNFASGGAGYDPFTSEFASVISLPDQLGLFEEYRVKLKAIVGEEKAMRIVGESLYVLVCGSNDIANTYFGSTVRSSQYDINSYTDLMLNSASTFVQDLYRLGARRVGVLSVPPIGCVPAVRTMKGGAQRNCAENHNQMALLFNSKLSAETQTLNQRLPGSRLIYIDIYQLPLDVINNPNKYGFRITKRGCCGTGTVEVAYLCRFACPDVADYVFWDSFHLTEKAYRSLVNQIFRQHIWSFIS